MAALNKEETFDYGNLEVLHFSFMQTKTLNLKIYEFLHPKCSN